MNKTIFPFIPKGVVAPPPSKSILHRALICAFLANKVFSIPNKGICEDVQITINALKEMGAVFQINKEQIMFLGRNIDKNSIVINVNKSASTIRFLLPLCNYLFEKCEFLGDKTLFNRPFSDYIRILDKQCINYQLKPNSLIVNGKLKLDSFKLLGEETTQFVSGFLFLNAFTKSERPLFVNKEILKSNYVSLTLNELQKFGFVFSKDETTLSFKKLITVDNFKQDIEPDYSCAAYFLALSTFYKDLKVVNIDKGSLQPDSEILKILEKYNNNRSSFSININNFIDLGPILFVLAAVTNGTSVLEGIKRLKLKESNRIDSMINELSKTGVVFELQDDKILIKGKSNFTGEYIFDSHNDHRIAMSLAIFGLIAQIKFTILNAECVNKSYPDFFNVLESLNA